MLVSQLRTSVSLMLAMAFSLSLCGLNSIADQL
jgi:hypothetical protein